MRRALCDDPLGLRFLKVLESFPAMAAGKLSMARPDISIGKPSSKRTATSNQI